MPNLRRLHIIATLLLVVSQASLLAAQKNLAEVPKRPVLREGRDTNSAPDYFYYGAVTIEKQPEKAGAAFYWAARLDPTWAPPLYGRHAALLLTEPQYALTAYITRRKGALRDPDLRYIDSLEYLALIKTPFLDRRLENTILSTWLARETGGTADVNDLGMYDRRFAAWAAYARGDFQMAGSIYDEQLKRFPWDIDLHFMRALVYLALGRPDSARMKVQSTLSLERDVEADIPGLGWSSHAFEEYSVGTLFEMVSQEDSARAAFQRALLDDLSFHPAHQHLAKMRLAAHDTAGAVDEYRQAVTLAPSDAGYLYDLGMLLLATGHPDSATSLLLKATTLEPYWAVPHYPLGVVYANSGFSKEAAEHYTAFIRLAPRVMVTAIAAARERLTALEAK